MSTKPPTQRIAIVFHETYLGCAPSLINAARLLDEQGWSVDIIMRKTSDGFSEPPNLGENVETILVDLPRDSSLNPIQTPGGQSPSSSSILTADDAQSMSWKSRLRGLLPKSVTKRLERVRETRVKIRDSFKAENRHARSRFVDAVCFATGDRRYDAVIGVDMLGLAAATPLAERLKIPLVYWSLEIMFLRQFWSPSRRRDKRVERRCHQRADVLVIQDTERQASLCEENRARHCPTILIPNSPRGRVADGLPDEHFHRQFDLDPETRVILHAGSICEGMRSSDLAASAALLPENCRLIFHSHSPIDLKTHYYRDIVESGEGKVLISTHPVPYDELDSLMASADIGIVIYDSSLGPNFQLLAGASGKLSHYLRCGVPVISVGNPSIARVLDENRCGIGVDRVEAINAAVQNILSDHAQYQSRAKHTYENKFEFEKHFRDLLSFLYEKTSAGAMGGEAGGCVGGRNKGVH